MLVGFVSQRGQKWTAEVFSPFWMGDLVCGLIEPFSFNPIEGMFPFATIILPLAISAGNYCMPLVLGRKVFKVHPVWNCTTCSWILLKHEKYLGFFLM